jgi:predicted site-specific integrase-resolvase
MKAKEVLRITGITRETLCRLVKKGRMRVKRLPNGYLEYNDDDVYKYAGIERSKLNILYARVSTAKQQRDLENQGEMLEKFCLANGYKIDKMYKDVASGIDFEKRKDFFEVLDLVIKRRVGRVFITYKDRLSRVGFGLFKHLFQQFGTDIVVINEAGNEKLDSQEILEEIISLLHAFSIKHYSNRRKIMKIKRVLYEKDSKDES